MLSRKLPPSLREIVNLGLGFYLFTGGIAIFCDWKTPEHFAVLYVLLIGFLLAFIASEIFSAVAILLMRTFLKERQ